MNQYSTTHRSNSMTQLNTDIGVNAQIIAYSGAAPANVAAAVTGTLLAQWAGNASQFGTIASGVLTASVVAAVAAAAAGVAGYYRINTSGGTAVAQGTIFQTTNLNTNALTAANGNVLNFAATTGVSVGMTVSGTGVVAGTTVIAVTGTTVTMSNSSTAGVANAAAITFGGDMSMTNTNIAAGQTCNFTSLTVTATGA